MTELKPIDAFTAKTLVDHGKAVLVDIRESDEFAREHLPGAISLPLSRFDPAKTGIDRQKTVIFLCASGARTSNAAPQLLSAGCAEAFRLEKGLAGWKEAGLKTVKDRSAPLPIQRQVQITAGLMVLLGVVLGFTVSPWFFLLSGFVGAGLTFAGISGTCAMASLLAVMPWNRRGLA